MPTPIPQGNFTRLRDVLALAAQETSFLEKSALALALDWLKTRQDLTERFVDTIVLRELRKEWIGLYQHQWKPIAAEPRKASSTAPGASEREAEHGLDTSDAFVEGFSPFSDEAGCISDAVYEHAAADCVYDAQATESLPVSPSPVALSRMRQFTPDDYFHYSMAVLLDETLEDGTRLGDATRPQLFDAANSALAHAKTKMKQRNYYYLLARSLPDDTTPVGDHWTEEEVRGIRLRAEKDELV